MTKKIRTTPRNPFDHLIQKMRSEEIVHLSQLGNKSGQSAVLAMLLGSLPGSFAWITKDEKEARTIETLVSYFAQDHGGLFVYRLTDPPDPQAFATIQRKDKCVIILPVELLRSAFPDRKSYDKATEHLEIGERRSPIELSQRLAQHGYAFNTEADQRATFSRRGEILDIALANTDEAVRIEFSDNAIERISGLSRNGAKPKQLKTAVIPPARLGKGTVSFWSIWPEKPTLIYEDFEGEEHPQWKDVESREGFKRFVLYPFKTQSSESVGIHSAPLYHNDLDGAVKALRTKRKEGWSITFLVTDSSKRVPHFVKEKLGWDASVKSAPEAVEGFMVELSKQMVMTDKELFGRDTVKAGKNNVLEQAFLSNLEEGDFVVHADHGVGKFVGMTTNEIEGIRHEYFLLEYAEQDKLYVPVESADKLTKYLGTEQPKLHRLSGSSWNAITRKIKDEARVLAKELLQLYASRSMVAAPVCGPETDAEKALSNSFPYDETADQKQAIYEVTADLQKNKPMDRLICGDVGFGKTEVAIRAAFKVVSNGFQVALLSPTTILTQQHFDTFAERLHMLRPRIANLSRFQTKAEQDQVIRNIATGDVDIVIGTHRLLSPDISFKRLGLVIIDEEQRFGVKHKEQLKKLRNETHVLTLTATPIPRTQ